MWTLWTDRTIFLMITIGVIVIILIPLPTNYPVFWDVGNYGLGHIVLFFFLLSFWNKSMAWTINRKFVYNRVFEMDKECDNCILYVLKNGSKIIISDLGPDKRATLNNRYRMCTPHGLRIYTHRGEYWSTISCTGKLDFQRFHWVKHGGKLQFNFCYCE